MKKIALTGILLLLVGCPSATNLNGKNSVTLHNNWTSPVMEFSVARITDQTGATPHGIDLLAEDLAPGKTFRVDNLEDGTYYLLLKYQLDSSPAGYSHSAATQPLEGGKNFDWYFDPAKKSFFSPSATAEPSVVEKVLLWFFGK